ncbi:unnamed protein product [Amaranthus hypochondriacus]
MSNSLIQLPPPSSSSSQSSHHSRVSNGNQACAACKYQRRKCAPDCLLAPYFPHHRQREFLNAHKLFGVSNITKIIRDLTPTQKDQAMESIIFQSNMRAKDPVNGCLGLIRHLEYQITYYRSEFHAISQRIEYYKAQFHNHQQQQQQQQQQHAVPLYQSASLGSVPPDRRIEIECAQNNTSAEDHNNSYHQINNESVSYQNNIDNFQHYQNLMRIYRNDEANQGNNQQSFIPYVSPGIANQNEQYSWIANQQEAMLPSPSSSTNHGRQGFVMKNDFGEESEMKQKINMTGNGSGEYNECKFNNCSNVDISYSDHNLQSDRFNEEEEIDILENQEDESLHNIYGLDLRNPASLFTLTN